MFHFSHSKIIESFIDVSVIYELSVLAGNLPMWLFAVRNGHSTEIDLCLAQVQLFLPWVKVLNKRGWQGTRAFPLQPTHLVTKRFHYNALMFLLVLCLTMGTQKLNLISLLLATLSQKAKVALGQRLNSLPSAGNGQPSGEVLVGCLLCCCWCCIWRGDGREVSVSQGVSQALSSD